jgi:hypothetical protein
MVTKQQLAARIEKLEGKTTPASVQHYTMVVLDGKIVGRCQSARVYLDEDKNTAFDVERVHIGTCSASPEVITRKNAPAVMLLGEKVPEMVDRIKDLIESK